MTPVAPQRLLPYGSAAVLAEFDDEAPSWALTAWASAVGRLDGISEVVPGARTVLVAGPGVSDERLIDVEVDADDAEGTRDLVEIAVSYDGDDLDTVAASTDLTVDDVVAAHTAPTYRCAFCGFAPGFSYLEGLDDRLVLPRRDSPRERVPTGSVAIASCYTAVYPRPSPGGWHLLGRTDASMFDLSRRPPATIPPGTAVRFVAR